MTITRRRFLAAGSAATLLTLWSSHGMAKAMGTGPQDRRLLVVMLRGALDGLHAVVPQGDADYARLRGALAPQQVLTLDNGFALHPALAFSRELYAQGQWAPLLAVAPPYRQRSHFEAQDCVENGTLKPGGANTGWLNRCVASMHGVEALSVGAVTPLIARGPGEVMAWSPPLPDGVNPVLAHQLQALYAADATLAAPFARALAEQGMAPERTDGAQLVQAMQAAADFMGRADGPRVGFVEDSGWDTHANQAQVLQRKLAELDAGLRAFHDHAGGAWRDTAVVVVTEFGRTAAVNGTGGTDHGTGGVAFLAGGAVRGGRLLGDWPGLSPSALNEGRDLRATTDMRALFKGLLRDHLGVSEAALETRVFPDSRGIKPLEKLTA